MGITQYFCAALFVLSASFPRSCLGIQCYQCGAQDGDASLSCDIFLKAPMWRQFEVECPTSPAHLCGKTITHYEDGSEPSEVRGCAPAENAFKVPNRMGCGRDDGPDQTIFCLCGTDLCNGANRLPFSPSITFSFVFVLNFLILRTFLFS